MYKLKQYIPTLNFKFIQRVNTIISENNKSYFLKEIAVKYNF